MCFAPRPSWRSDEVSEVYRVNIPIFKIHSGCCLGPFLRCFCFRLHIFLLFHWQGFARETYADPSDLLVACETIFFQFAKNFMFFAGYRLVQFTFSACVRPASRGACFWDACIAHVSYLTPLAAMCVYRWPEASLVTHEATKRKERPGSE